MVPNISATSYNKIFRNESHILVNFNWNCTSRCILFIQRKYINVASRHAKLGSLAYSIVFATIFGLAMWYVGISKIGSTKVMVYMYLVPLFAVIFAAVTIGEQINMMQLVGGLIIFIGLYVVKRVEFKSQLSI